MKNDIATDPRFDASDQERLMALLALTVQELPIVDAPSIDGQSAAIDSEDYFVRLDADPEALETYLRRGMKVVRTPARATASSNWSSKLAALASWFTPPRVRLAAAFGVALFAVVVAYWQVSSRDSLLGAVEQSYADVTIDTPRAELVLPWERDASSLGFSPATGNDSIGGRAFAQGLLRGQAKLPNAEAMNQASNVSKSVEHYVALGEWNVLLWAASQSDAALESGFWQRQLSVARRFADASFASEDNAIITGHLTIVEPMLAELSSSASAPRAARQLADELTRFREAFAPHAPTALDLSPDLLPDRSP